MTDPDPQSVSVSAPSSEVEEGATLQLTASVAPFGAPQGVTWGTDDITVALVSAAGLVTPVSLGEVTITATSTADPTRSGSIDITVTCRNLTQAMVADGGTVPGDVCYQALSPLSVNTGTLVVEAGANISFGTSSSLNIASAGRLTAVGTIDNPITFTSLDPAEKWRGIHFDGSASLDNQLEHAVLENGGGSGWSGAEYATAGLYMSGASRVDVSSVEITGSGGTGFTASADTEFTLAASTLAGNAVAGWAHPNAVRGIGSDNVIDGNDEDVIRVAFGNNDAVQTSQSWAAAGVPYQVWTRMFVRAPLSLDPGVVLRFRADVSMIVMDGGTLNAVGTAGAPILFSSTEDLPGYWKGVQIETVSADNVFDHVIFENGGSEAFTGGNESRAMVFMSGNSKVTITNSTFRGSGYYGLWVPSGGDITGFSDNHFEDNERTMIVHPNRVGGIAASNTFVDNAEQAVRVTFGNNDAVIQAQTWEALDVPYLVAVRTFVRAPLTIAPGTALLFAQNVSLIVTTDGSLNAEGTVELPITFSGREALSAYWKGIEFGTVSAGNALTNVLLEHAGSEQWFGGVQSVSTLYVTANGSLDLSDVTIRETGGYALILGSGGMLTCSNVDDGGFQYLSSPSGAVSATCP
ncbi:MAG: hypothetical protein HKN72_15285 [Gemmatimonadetes bacterium]|nr:hypothetical protein [Gemmatimonadota bacterium]